MQSDIKLSSLNVQRQRFNVWDQCTWVNHRVFTHHCLGPRPVVLKLGGVKVSQGGSEYMATTYCWKTG